MLIKNRYTLFLIISFVFISRSTLLYTADVKLPKPPEVPPALKKANDAYAQKLFNQVKADRSKGIFTQSQAQLSIPAIQKKVQKSNLLKLQRIQQEAFKREQEHRNNYYVFYSAVPSQFHFLQDIAGAGFLRLLQDLTKALYKRVIQPLPELKDFQFLRYTFRNPRFSNYENITQFMKEQVETVGLIDDSRPPAIMKPLLLSTNLAYFGNEGLEGESTMHYLNHPQPWAKPPAIFLEECLASFGYPLSFVDELMELSQTIKVDTGDLFQIFIPHAIVDQVAYLSWRQGIPFDIPIIKKIFKRKSMTFGRNDKIYLKDILEHFDAYQTLFQEKDPAAISIQQELLTNIDNGKYTLHKSGFLNKYIHQPYDVPFINYYEARLLMTNKYMLNPLSGIKIYRYSTIDPVKKKIYKQQLTAILDKMDAIRTLAKERLETPPSIQTSAATP